MKRTTSTTKKTISLFWHHATRYKRLLLPLFFTIPLTVLVMDFLLPYIMSLVLQKISQNNYNPHELWHSFGPYIIAYTIGTFMSGVAGWRLNIWLIWNLEFNVVRDIGQRIFDHLMDMSAGFHANRFAGSLVSQANKLTGAYIRLVDATVFNLYTLLIAMVATVIILAPRVPIYAISLLILSAVYIVGTIFFSRPVRDANTLEAEAQSQQTGYLADSLSNIMAVKSFSADEYEKQRYWKVGSHTRDMGHLSMKTTMIRETYSSMVTSTIGVTAVAIAVLGAGVFHANIATLFLIVSYTAGIGQRLWEFQNVLRQYNRALGDASDMVNILEIEPEVKDPVKPEMVRIVRGDIRIENMAFTHDENDDALFHDLTLHIKAGEKIGLVGHSGSGKTTLTKLLLRYSDIDTGAIYIDGQDISKITQHDLRKHIAYVPQEPLLFHRTLSENIAYGQSGATSQEIEGIAKLANAHEFIGQLPKGYDTLVGERGVKLSGGQRQRVAIARAMLKNAPILILDEATSALDSESEALIQDALWRLMEGRTAIVVAHRLSTIQKMDRIVVLEDGKIVEEGTHKELVRQNGTYASLWAHQSGGFMEE
ncbi:MAG TPA: ABC transporter ATP-binding protein [Candidatus Saccharimonadales bacterium]|nr:ABC transporter ATP-binding protein [Candidatus Saccharimonadales bacterium]